MESPEVVGHARRGEDRIPERRKHQSDDEEDGDHPLARYASFGTGPGRMGEITQRNPQCQEEERQHHDRVELEHRALGV